MTERKKKKECKKALVLVNRAIIREARAMARAMNNPYRFQRICDEVMILHMEKLEKLGIPKEYYQMLTMKYLFIHTRWGDRNFFTKLLKKMRSLRIQKW